MAAIMRRLRPSPRREEDRDQADLAAWLDLHVGPTGWFHPANEGARSAREGARLKRAGLKRGVPDVVIIVPPPNEPGTVGTALELKSERGRATKEQREWLESFAANNWASLLCYGYSEAVQCLQDLGYGKLKGGGAARPSPAPPTSPPRKDPHDDPPRYQPAAALENARVRPYSRCGARTPANPDLLDRVLDPRVGS